MSRAPGPPRLTSPLDEAIALHQRGKLNQARKIYREVIARQPGNADALELLAQAAAEGGDFVEAARILERATQVRPGSLNAHFNLGTALRRLQRLPESEASFQKALAIAPDRPEVLYQLGQSAAALGRLDEAAAHYHAAVERNPGFADAHFNLGVVLALMGNLGGAVGCFEKASALEPNSAAALVEGGKALLALNRVEAGATALEEAVRREPKSYLAHAVLGAAYRLLKRYPDAIATLERAVAIDKDRGDALFELIMTRHAAADWHDLPRLEAAAARLARRGHDADLSMHVLSVIDDPAVHHSTARAFVRSRWPEAEAPASPAIVAADRALGLRARSSGPLRVGYFSTDFGDHPVGNAISGLVAAHDRSRVEVHAFSLSDNGGKPFRPAIREAFDHWHQVADRPATSLVAEARALGLDIAIDLNGHTAGAHTAIFTQRCAPIQVNYLGFPCTSGLARMDYIIGDPTIMPPGAEAHYDEAVVRLPGCYLANDLARESAGTASSRAANGLPEQGLVFAAFHAIYKIGPELFAVWMRLLQSVPGSVLWLPSADAAVKANLVREAEARGVAGSRLVFATFVEARADHIARHALADLFLDCQPYNAHTTAADALWAGLPVLTCTGRTFPSRVGGSLLHALAQPGLVTSTLAEYEARALALARDPAALAALKAELLKARTSSPLYDSRRLARRLEWAFTRMAERSAAGEPRQAFDVPDTV